MNLIKYPDAPILSSSRVLSDLEAGVWLAQFKLDGWRCIIQLGDTSASFISRHNKPLPVSDSLASKMFAILRERNQPGTIFDAEYMGRRDGQSEAIFIFDVLRAGETWFTNYMQLAERFWFLQQSVPPELIVEHATRDYAAFFESSRRPGVEGIVLKRLDSIYLASPRASRSNPAWIKVRHRAGEAGQTRIA